MIISPVCPENAGPCTWLVSSLCQGPTIAPWGAEYCRPLTWPLDTSMTARIYYPITWSTLLWVTPGWVNVLLLNWKLKILYIHRIHESPARVNFDIYSEQTVSWNTHVVPTMSIWDSYKSEISESAFVISEIEHDKRPTRRSFSSLISSMFFYCIRLTLQVQTIIYLFTKISWGYV